MTLTLTDLEQRFTAAGLPYHVLTSGTGRAFITERGARVLGLFPTPDAPNLFWTAPALTSDAAFAGFLADADWNLGGDRCWIAPELGYHVSDRARFSETNTVPPASDPGAFTLEPHGDGVRLHQTMTTPVYNFGTGDKTLSIDRWIRPAADPLAGQFAGLHYTGYEQTAELTELDGPALPSEVWSLVQLHAGGTLIIPAHGDAAATRYFGDPPDETLRPADGAFRVPITATRQFKLGFKALHVTGRMGYYAPLADGTAYLLVRNFFNDPSNLYGEEPPEQPGNTGHSTFVYNDDGKYARGGQGSFGEMECSGRTIGGPTGRTRTVDTFTLWAYHGAAAAVRAAAGMLLGVRV